MEKEPKAVSFEAVHLKLLEDILAEIKSMREAKIKSSMQKAYDEGYLEGRQVGLEEAAEITEADNNHCGKRIAATLRALKDAR